ncbi:hypothetical protein [Lysinibacillus xylanilyticus]|uniref:hypothetical protein n=1 Tax=Lysinibacillus xylanilyticus TaxID=582475 RepID=UPI003D975B39
MNKQLLDKLKVLTNLIIEVDPYSSIKENEQQAPMNLSIRRGNPRKSRAEKEAKLKIQLDNLLS